MKYNHQRYLRYFVLLSTSNRSSFYDLINCSIELNLVCCLISFSVWKRTEIKVVYFGQDRREGGGRGGKRSRARALKGPVRI